MKYVVGFIFSRDLDKVWLIRKNRPEWQAGKLNGIGGKVEPGESFEAAMIREAKEEADYTSRWNLFAELMYPDAHLQFFWSLGFDDTVSPRTCEDEPVECWGVADLINQTEIVPNLRWLIPAAINNITDPYGVFLYGRPMR